VRQLLAENEELKAALGEAHVELRVWKKSGSSSMFPSAKVNVSLCQGGLTNNAGRLETGARDSNRDLACQIPCQISDAEEVLLSPPGTVPVSAKPAPILYCRKQSQLMF
jgi:hypothetical protein